MQDNSHKMVCYIIWCLLEVCTSRLEQSLEHYMALCLTYYRRKMSLQGVLYSASQQLHSRLSQGLTLTLLGLLITLLLIN